MRNNMPNMKLTLQEQNEIALAETLSAYVRLLLWPEGNIGKWKGYGLAQNCKLCKTNEWCNTCILRYLDGFRDCTNESFHDLRNAIEYSKPVEMIVGIAHLRFDEILAHIANNT